MLPSTSFFKTTSVKPEKTGAKKVIIDVGGEPFHALTIAFIDQFKNGNFLPNECIKTILNDFFAYFPEYKLNQTYVAPLEQMRQLLNNPRKSEIVANIAYILRQITVDELLKNPLAYKKVFQDFTSNTSQAYLRQSETFLDLSSLTALATALKINLILSFKEQQKELRHREIYDYAIKNFLFTIELQIQENYCLPRVNNKEDFIAMNLLPIVAPKPQVIDRNEETITKQLELIAEDNHKIWKEYQHQLVVLKNLIADLSLTKKDIIELYIQFLPNKAEPELFNYLEKTYGTTKIVNEPGDKDSEYILLLTAALARGLSLRQINANDFFEACDEQPKNHSISIVG